MGNFVVGYLSFFDNELKLIKVEEESEYEAIKKVLVLVCEEQFKQEEINFQNSENYPKDKESLIDMLYDSDITVNIIEI